MTILQPMVQIGRGVLHDVRHRPASGPSTTYRQRIDAGLSWLCRAQDHGADRGFSYGYTIRGGWQPSYIETTGYIISTFLRAATELNRPSLAARAVEAGEWLLDVQLPDGSFPNPSVAPHSGLVFDTGQDLFGLLALSDYTKDPRFERGAQRATRWLTEVADDQGRWTKSTYNSIPHVYNARTAWALVSAALRYDDTRALRVGRANLDWACDQQLPNGWFDNCAFTPGEAPFTHNTAYAGRGLLESGLLLGETRYLDAAHRVATAASLHLGVDGRLPGRISPQDRPVTSSVCLTGSAQFAIIWLKLAANDFTPDDNDPDRLSERNTFGDYAIKAIAAVGRQQAIDGPIDVRGAVPGSSPLWGRYAPLSYPNWATKFFVDSVLLAQRTHQ